MSINNWLYCFPSRIDQFRQSFGKETLIYRHALLLENGLYEAVVFPVPVHYQDDTGSFVSIDNNLDLITENDHSYYENRASPVRVRLAQTVQPRTDDWLMELAYQDSTVRWRLSAEQSSVNGEAPDQSQNFYGSDDGVFYNTDEQVVLDAKFLIYYKGKTAIKLPIGANAASYGIMLIGNRVNDRTDSKLTIQHEYGHSIQFSKLGIIKYTVFIAYPSIECNLIDRVGLLPFDYYSMPWEYQADVYGSVIRREYEPWAEEANKIYSSFIGIN